jgi:outer membrane biogenesis lipoprotein LolB
MMPRIRFLRVLVAFAFLLGCARGLKPQAPVDSTQNVIVLARERPVPAALRARFHIKLKSEQLDVAGSTGGGLVVERPGHGYFAVMGPLGSPLVTFASDGEGLAILLAREKRHLVATEAEAVVREVTGGTAGLDDLWAVLTGDLPFDDAKVKTWKAEEEGVRAVFVGPKKTLVVAMLDPVTGTMRWLEASRQKKLLLKATYAPYKEVDGQLMPTEVALEVPSLDLVVTLRFKTWKAIDEMPDVFGQEAPGGIQSEPLERLIERWAEKRREASHESHE